MNIKAPKTITYLLATTFTICTLVAVATRFVPFNNLGNNVSSEDKIASNIIVQDKQLVYDKALLKTFSEVLSQFSSAKRTYTLAGSITVANKADSTQNMGNVAFIMCKNGDDFYYRQGFAESLNKDSVFLDINTTTKKVILTPKRQLAPAAVLDSATLIQLLRDENYSLKNDTMGNYQTISLVNENNLSCRQYAITFDVQNKRATRIQMRMANPQHPEDKKLEKIIDIKISKFTDEGDTDNYRKVSQVIDKNGGLTGNYANYKLITIN